MASPITPRSLAQLPSLPNGSPPRLVPLTKTISLVVADVPEESYHAAAIESRLTELDWVSRCGSAHHAVADALAPTHTVVPLRLFTLFSSEERARTTLGSAAGRIAAAIGRVHGKGEWVLRIGPPDPSRGTQGSVEPSARATTGTSFLAQKAAVKRAASDLAAIVRNDAERAVDRLAASATEVNRRPQDASAGLLVDAAFLVPTRSAAAFKRRLSTLATRLLAAGCRVSLTGPWPPYSFVDLAAEGDASG